VIGNSLKIWVLGSVLLAALLPVALAGPATRPATTTTPTTTVMTRATTAPTTPSAATNGTKRAGSQPTTLDAKEKEKKLRELTRTAIELMNKKQFRPAESALAEAIALEPKEPTNLYNMACLLAQTNRKDAALSFLEQSAEAGFIDFIHITNDTDLNSLHEDDRYKAFMAKKDKYLRKAAEATIEALRKRFGEDYLYEIDDADKLIFATNTDRPTLDALKQNLVRQAHSQWDQIFSSKPEQYIAVVVPSPREFHKIIRMPGVEGIYQHDSRTLIAKGLGFVTMHEFTHALHAADLDGKEQDHPIWLVEGMAVLFERAEYEKGPDGKEVLTPQDNERLVRLQADARQKKLVPLSRLFKMEQPEFLGSRVMQCYAESGSVMHYLYDQKLLRPFYDTFKEEYKHDKTGRAALEKVTGKPLDEFEADWKAWMLTRLPPSGRLGPESPYLGVEFGESNDGMLIQTVKTRGPAARAGLRVGDVIIAVDGKDTRDQMTFGPTLTAHKPGDKVVLRLRRNHAYLEVPMILGSRNDPNSGGAVGK
jgi:tetratricopeptide (TPR) repeat protein